MNDIAQYMQETGLLSRDYSDFDEYEKFLQGLTYLSYRLAITREEWQSMINEIATLEQEMEPLITVGYWHLSDKQRNRWSIISDRLDFLYSETEV